MKKLSVFVAVLVAALVFSYCSSSKNASSSAAAPAPKHGYENTVANIIQTNCAPCHFPDKGGNKKPLDSYAAVSSQVDEVIKRIQLNPGDRGFMPNRKPKLSDTDINAIKQWKADGLAK